MNTPELRLIEHILNAAQGKSGEDAINAVLALIEKRLAFLNMDDYTRDKYEEARTKTN